MNATWIFVVGVLLIFAILCFVFFYQTPTKLKYEMREDDEAKCVKPGYYWYDDDTFSKSRLPEKKLKAIVELIEDGIIYGDLTASELFSITEQELTWDEAKKFFENFSYPCKKNEKIVWYDIYQLINVQKTYLLKVYNSIPKRPRCGGQWSRSECCSLPENAFIRDFHYEYTYDTPKVNKFFVRPVIAMKCLAPTLLDCKK